MVNTVAGATQLGQRVYFWAGVSQVGRQAIQFLVLIVLARLLTPAQFGLAAIVLTVSLFATIFTDLGLSTAVIQVDVLNEAYLSTVFWLNAATGFVLAGVFTGVAPAIARFYGNESLVPLFRVAGLLFALSLFAVQKSLLERELQFRRLAGIEISCAAAGAAVSVGLAAGGAGAISLVVGPVVTVALSTVLYAVFTTWRPSMVFSFLQLRVIWSYCWGLLGFNILNYWSGSLDNLVAGRLGPAAVGLYSRAFTLMMVPVQQFATAIARGLLPRLSKIKADKRAFGTVWMSAISLSWLLGVAVFSVMLTSGDDLAYVLLGPRWRGVGILLEILAISIPPSLIMRSNGAVFQASGNTSMQFKLGAWTSLIAVCAILFGYRWGVEGIAWGVVVSRYLAVVVCLPFVLRLCEVTLESFARGLLRGLLAACVGMAVAAAIHWMLDSVAPVVRLVTTATLFALTYAGALWLLGEPTIRRASLAVVRRKTL